MRILGILLSELLVLHDAMEQRFRKWLRGVVDPAGLTLTKKQTLERLVLRSFRFRFDMFMGLG